jgi:hypothetical protein
MNAEYHFIFGIILYEEAAQVFLQAIVMAAKRLKDANGRLASRSRQSSRQKPPRGCNNEYAIDE